jgi:predicted transcriptional regulator
MNLSRLQFETLVHLLDAKESLAAALKISDEEADKALRELEEAGLLDKEGKVTEEDYTPS